MTHAAFLQSIIAAPDDDAPRLVYADWLEEHGGEPERAEFIRVQCELARTKCYFDNGSDLPCGDFNKKFSKEGWECKSCQLIEALRRREGELWTGGTHNPVTLPDEIMRNWSYAISDLFLSGRYPALVVRRGFIESVICTWFDWLTHAGAIRAATPLREVRLTTRPTVEDLRTLYGRLKPAQPSMGVLELLEQNGHHAIDDRRWRDFFDGFWPGITPHLPPAIRAGDAVWTDENGNATVTRRGQPVGVVIVRGAFNPGTVQ